MYIFIMIICNQILSDPAIVMAEKLTLVNFIMHATLCNMVLKGGHTDFALKRRNPIEFRHVQIVLTSNLSCNGMVTRV